MYVFAVVSSVVVGNNCSSMASFENSFSQKLSRHLTQNQDFTEKHSQHNHAKRYLVVCNTSVLCNRLLPDSGHVCRYMLCIQNHKLCSMARQFAFYFSVLLCSICRSILLLTLEICANAPPISLSSPASDAYETWFSSSEICSSIDSCISSGVCLFFIRALNSSEPPLGVGFSCVVGHITERSHDTHFPLLRSNPLVHFLEIRIVVVLVLMHIKSCVVDAA